MLNLYALLNLLKQLAAILPIEHKAGGVKGGI